MSRYTAADDPDDDVDDTERLRIDDESVTDDEAVETDEQVETDERVTTDEESGDGFWDFGVVTTLVAVGLALVVFPEPATTITGVLLVAVGVSLAILDAVA